MTRCVHCTKPITDKQPGYRYPISRREAHLACVSLKSAEAMDLLILAKAPRVNRVVERRAR